MPQVAQSVSFPGARWLDGYLALPESAGGGPCPGVVVIHEIFGLTDSIRSVADRLAAEGYAALAVDLFAGRNRVVRTARFIDGLLARSLDHEGIRDLKASLGYLAGLPEVDGDRLGALGFSMGGSFASAWACTDERLKAVASFYGVNPRPLEAVRDSCPVVGSFPGKDFTGGQAEQLEKELERSGVPHDIKIYPAARHSFFDDQRRAHDADAAGDSWRRTTAFFRQHIGRNAACEQRP
ncbi:MAG: dienelactone hydrolase family protein [Rubrobacteraceae bacterium]